MCTKPHGNHFRPRHIDETKPCERAKECEEDFEGRCRATWKREFKLPWREAGPLNDHDDKVDSDQ